MPVYATIDDYANYMGEPSTAEFSPRYMTRASLVIDKALVGAIYPTDVNGLPTGTDINGVNLTDVFRDATCAQARTLVEDWEEWPTPVGCCPDCQLTAEAFDILRGSGLIPIVIRMWG
jgi:hypothetical protein